MTRKEREKSLALEALKLARLDLLRKLPVLGAAVQVPGQSFSKDRSGTDAEILYWNAEEVLAWFVEGICVLERKYLHLLLHGVYLHRFRHRGSKEHIWWLACDIMVEYRIDRMHVPGFAWPIPGERSRCYRRMREEKIAFTERALAAWLAALSKEEFQKIEQVFRMDEHCYWREEDGMPSRIYREQRAEKMQRISQTVHRWRTVFEQLELFGEEHRRAAGGSGGNQTEQIVLQKERGYDYRQFLKQFAVEKEELSLDMDSFDYIPYDYSRRMYDNLVFLEPLEYKELHKLQEFVIAIDTSGSCSGEVVKRFLTETWEIFQEKENFFKDMRIHLIQCDCLVQEHVCVTCEEEWKDYLANISVKGHGDTDFTPVFRLVDKMVASGECKRLKGLLYFTDGDGIYPDKQPQYDTAFVFLNEELQKGSAPSWAQTLTLELEMGDGR